MIAVVSLAACKFAPNVQDRSIHCNGMTECPSGYFCVTAGQVPSPSSPGVCCKNKNCLSSTPPAQDGGGVADGLAASPDGRGADGGASGTGGVVGTGGIVGVGGMIGAGGAVDAGGIVGAGSGGGGGSVGGGSGGGGSVGGGSGGGASGGGTGGGGGSGNVGAGGGSAGSGAGGTSGRLDAAIDAPVPPPDVPVLLPAGATCKVNSDCALNHCVEGVCCDGACGQTCRSCLGSKTGGQDGTCANMTPGSACTGGVCNSTTGTTPACVACAQGNSCPPANVCKTGKLDCSTGTPVCKEDQNLDATHACGPAASCSTTTNKATRAQMCDGVGNCPAAVVDACAYGCNGTVCATAKSQGSLCGSTAECANELSCADSYCCNSACTGSCQACNVAGSLGTCTTLISGDTPHSGRVACAGSGLCQGTCNGSSTLCSYPGAETTCVQASCTGQTATMAASCAGNGACATATTKPCNGYGCNGTVCGTGTSQGGACSPTGTPCASGLYCTDGLCSTAMSIFDAGSTDGP